MPLYKGVPKVSFVDSCQMLEKEEGHFGYLELVKSTGFSFG